MIHRSQDPEEFRLKRILFNSLLLLILVLSACTPTLPGSPTSTPRGASTATLRDPLVQTTSSPDPAPVARAFLENWVIEDYNKMYDALTRVSRDAITREKLQHILLGAWRERRVPYLLVTHSVEEFAVVGGVPARVQGGRAVRQGEQRGRRAGGCAPPARLGGQGLRLPARASQR